MSGNWRKASCSFANGNCVEVGTDWRKAARSISNGACVEVGAGKTVVLVRDTTDRDGGTLAVTADAWTRFLGSVRA